MALSILSLISVRQGRLSVIAGAACDPSLVASKSFMRRCFVTSASSDFANENREFVIVGGGNAAGYAARTFVEHGMADGRLCIVSKEVSLFLSRSLMFQLLCCDENIRDLGEGEY
ncbi:hypothetical protein Dimus_030891 [Dionaea muscipula]